MRILVIGYNGFIAGFIVDKLEAAGYEVRGVVRKANPSRDLIALDVASCRATDWLGSLSGIDAVVNCVGILRESGDSTYEAVHVAAVKTLIEACEQAGVPRLIQISAIGDPVDAFIASKYRGDDEIKSSSLSWTILRPSVVYSAADAYGGTALLRALAALPGALLVPGNGDERLQPITGEDVGEAVVSALRLPAAELQVIELVGPETLSIRSYLARLRRWFGVAPGPTLRVPMGLVRLACSVADISSRGPLGRTMFSQLARENVGEPGALGRMQKLLDLVPVRMEDALTKPPRKADYFHARSYFLPSLLRWLLGALWLMSGIVGLAQPVDAFAPLLSPLGLSIRGMQWIVLILSVADIGVGLWFWFARRARRVAWLMLAMLIGYSVYLSLMLPVAWLEPLGGVLKNFAVAGLLVTYLLMTQRSK